MCTHEVEVIEAEVKVIKVKVIEAEVREVVLEVAS